MGYVSNPDRIVEFSLPDRQRLARDIGRDLALGLSMWRSHMNAVLAQLEITGPVLEIGSGSTATESRCWRRPEGAVTIDLDRARQPSAQADVLFGLPFKSATFQTCIALNVIEHLSNVEPLLREAWRLLRPGGSLVVAVPFLHRVHRAPVDHARYTDTTLQSMVSRCGFTSVRVAPCGSGPVTAALAQLDFAVPRRLSSATARGARLLDQVASRRSRGQFRNRWDYPLGYVVVASSAVLA